MIHLDVVQKPAIENKLGMVRSVEFLLLGRPNSRLAGHFRCPVADVVAKDFNFRWLLSWLLSQDRSADDE